MTIEMICDNIMKVVEMVRPPLVDISPIIMVCSAIRRPGLSAQTLASNIIRRQAEAGAPVGPAADGTQNIAEAMEVVRAEEYIKAFKMDARVDIAIPAGAIKIMAQGANPAGPVTVYGQSVAPVGGNGIIR